MIHKTFCVLLVSGIFMACSDSTKNKTATNPAVAESGKVHFFSVAWGCVEVEQSKLDAAAYRIKDYETKVGACPATLAVLTSSSKPLLQCPVVIGAPAIPASYVLYDKRSLDGQTVRDMRADGFTTENFCPAIAERTFN